MQPFSSFRIHGRDNLAMMPRYRHWRNWGQAGEAIFVSTTALDFVHVFEAPQSKDLMLRLLVSHHKRYGAALHAFVVMSNHLHFITRLPDGMDATTFVSDDW
jgi:hypothetical protein